MLEFMALRRVAAVMSIPSGSQACGCGVGVEGRGLPNPIRTSHSLRSKELPMVSRKSLAFGHALVAHRSLSPGLQIWRIRCVPEACQGTSLRLLGRRSPWQTQSSPAMELPFFGTKEMLATERVP